MALTATTLASAKATNDSVIVLTSATGAAVNMLALVDGEFMKISSTNLTPTIGVVPGSNGSTAGPHAVLAPVIYGLASDFPTVGGPATVSYGVSGAITVPVVDTVVYLTKTGSAAVMTLAAPNIGQQNTVIVVSTAAQAHTITFTPGFYGNTTTSDVATFPATINAVFTIKAQNGYWAPVATADDGVTIG